MLLPILATKLYIPHCTDKLIVRSASLQKMYEGFNNRSQLTLVCAPAGYGKTTLVLEFINSIETCVAWLSLDEGDNDVQRFMAYLVAAFKKAGVQVPSDLDLMITDMGFNHIETILTMLINYISEIEKSITFILDDFHSISSKKVNDALKFIIDHQPTNLHILIISREDPQFRLANLRMKGKLTEIRMQDLVFSNMETEDFFNNIVKLKLSREVIEKINSRTEGWIAGLQLAALLMNGYDVTEQSIEAYIEKINGSNRYIIDYLVEEVLEHLDIETREFLTKTSVLERMNASICNEIMDRTDSQEVLQRIEKSNLFLISLDENMEWYRYHHLFADSLKTTISAKEESELYKKAAIFMHDRHFKNEAVRYAFKSKDMQLALQMVEDSVIECFQNAQLDSLTLWIGMLPKELVRKSEILSVRYPIALFITGRAVEAIQYLSLLGSEFEKEASKHNKGLLYSLRAMMAGVSGQDAEPLAQEALTHIELWDPIARTSTLNTLGRAQYKKGNVTNALTTFKSAYESGLKLGYQFVTTIALMNYSSCLSATGQNQEALKQCDQYIDGMKKHFEKLPPYIGIIYLVKAEIYTKIDQSDKALKYEEEGTRLCKLISYEGNMSLKVFSEKDNEKKLENKAFGTELEFGEKFSDREFEILKLLTGGMSNQEISSSLFISINTVQWHISHIYSKLGVKSRAQAIVKARESGMI